MDVGVRLKPNNIFYKDCFSAGYYYRLSDEDKDKVDRCMESQSITTQRDVIHSAVDTGVIKDVKYYAEYVDDDYTGMNFNRPSFQMMMQDWAEHKIDCIIVKDFSRFGRDSERIKQFLEIDFEEQEHELRFIALGDSYDSLYKTPDSGVRMMLFMNEEYSQMQHTKVSLAIRAKQSKGDFIGAFARYGYKKDPNDKHHLIPDPTAFPVVQRMFQLAYYENMGAAEIAAIFTGEGLEPPAVYKRSQGSKYRCGKRIDSSIGWSPDTVNRMLQDKIYTGAVVQGKQRKETLRGKSKVMSPEKYIVVENRHEPAVEKEIFDEIQKKHRTLEGRITRHKSLFQGIIKCGDCSHALIKRTDVYGDKKYISYCCRTHKRMSSQCYPNTIGEETLKRIILDDFNRAAATIKELEKAVRRYENSGPAKELKRYIAQRITDKNNEYKEVTALLNAIEEKWLLDKLNDVKYKELLEKYEKKLQLIRKEILGLEKYLGRGGELSKEKWVEELIERGRITELYRAVLTAMVSAVYVSHDRTVHIVYKFSNIMDPLFISDTDRMDE